MNPHAFLLLVLLSSACATAPKRPPIDRVAAVAACEIHCAEVAEALVEHRQYDEARAPLARAWQHSEDRDREDVPGGPVSWPAHRLRLAVVGAVVAERTGVDQEKAQRRLWSEVEHYLEDLSYGGLSLSNVSFLSERDRNWLFAELDRTPALSERTRELLQLVWRANSGVMPDRLRLLELSKQADASREHLLSLYVLCAIGECRTDNATRHVAALVAEQNRLPDAELDSDILEGFFIETFMEEGGPQFREQMLALRDLSNRTDLSIPLAVPVRALGEAEACREFSGVLGTIVRRADASYTSLVATARCALSLGYRGWGQTLLSRARTIHHAPIEALEAFVEYEAVHGHAVHLRDYVRELQKHDPKTSATALLAAVEAAERADFDDAVTLIAQFPQTPAAEVIRGRREASTGRHAEAIAHFERALSQWPDERIGVRLLRQYYAVGRFADALAMTTEGLEIRASGWAILHGEAALATRDDDALKKALELLDDGDCSSLMGSIELFRRRYGVEAATRRLVERVGSLSRELDAHCAYVIGLQLAALVPVDQMESLTNRLALDPDVRDRALAAAPYCLGAALDARRRLHGPLDEVPKQNDVAWCMCQRGEFAEALQTLPDPGASIAARDTYARALLGVGRIDESLARFREIVAEKPHRGVYQVHLLAVELSSKAPPDDEEVARRVDVIARLFQDQWPDPFTLETLAAALDLRGHRAAAQRIREIWSRAARSAEHWRILDAKCSTCREAHRKHWGSDFVPP